MVQGRVKVNGEVITELGSRIDPETDRVEVDGRPVSVPAPRWIMLNKPPGTLTTAEDPHGRPTVYDLLPGELRELGLSYVGRLDMDTEGLLLMTNQGDLAHLLLHPSSEVEREYRVGVRGVPEASTVRRLTEGVELEDGMARALRARRLRREAGGAVLELVLREGRKREVRRLCEAVGHPVRWLRRIRFGPVDLGGLPTGEWRDLTAGEVGAIRRRVAGESGSR